MISMKKYGEKNKIILSPRFVSMEMVAIFDFMALTKVHVYNFKTASSNAVKSNVQAKIESIVSVKHITMCLLYV